MAKYKLNLRNSHLLEEFFQSWRNLTPCFHPLSTLEAELHQVKASSFLIFADAAAKQIICIYWWGYISQKFHAESLSGQKVKLALLKQILVAATESLLSDRHSHEYADGGIWTTALLAFREQRLEYLLINLGCHETIKLVMPWVGVRILLWSTTS